MEDTKANSAKIERFRTRILEHVDLFQSAVSTIDGHWVVKGFIDIAKNIYTLSADTKVISKVMELLLFPKLCEFAAKCNYKLVLCREQNHYPDVTFVDSDGDKFAVDLKSTYRVTDETVNGMTLGAFTGYFRDRKSEKNISFPYDDYLAHFILGLIYSRAAGVNDERIMYKITDLESIPSVAHSFQFFIHEKYRLACDRPGSGNTKNIGSVNKISDLINGTGPFSILGKEIFDDYWMFYLTKDMAKAAQLPKSPYRNLKEYKEFKQRVTTVPLDMIASVTSAEPVTDETEEADD